jgi:hypothetical protein
MSSNSALLSNSMSPLINSVEVKSNYEGFRYKLLSGVGACSKQRRVVKFQPAYGAQNSINLLKYGLCQKIYLKVVIRDSNAANDMILQPAAIIGAIDEITLSSHSKILERMDRIQIMKYVLDKAKSSNDNIFALTGYNPLPAESASAGNGIANNRDHVVYIPLPFSFFGSMDKAKDLLHLQQLTVNISWASVADAARLITSGTGLAAGWTFQQCELVINYLELPSAKLNELWNQNYSTNKPTNQLLLTTFKENEKLITTTTDATDFAIDLTTKGCVVKSYICIRGDPATHAAEKRTDFKPINSITFRCNGQDFYKADTDALEFERCIMSDNYNSLTTQSDRRTDYHAIYEVNHSVVPEVHAHKKYSQAISFKNLSAPQYVINFTADAGITSCIVEIIHVQLNLVAFSKQDGSCESILSI